jgi:hypothetical protein
MDQDHRAGPPTIRELDFSEFHPIDHLPATARCRSLPGGTRRHISLAWDYKWPTQIKRATLCRLGRHQWMPGWHGEQPCMVCRNCTCSVTRECT